MDQGDEKELADQSPRPSLEEDLANLALHVNQAAGPTTIECPNCHEAITCAYVARVPEKQHVSFVIQHSETGALSAKTLGGVIVETEKLLRAVAKDVGIRVHVFIDSLEHNEKETKIGLLITAVGNCKPSS